MIERVVSHYLLFSFMVFTEKGYSRIFLVGFCLVLLGFFCTLWNRYIYIDDAWFGEQAFWFSKYGVPRTESLVGYFGWDSHLLVYHRLNIIFGALLIKLFGWSVETLRVPTLLILAGFFFVLFRYFKANESTFGKKAFFIWVPFIFANPLIIFLSFTYRPEILLMFLGFLSWWMVEKSVKTKDSNFLQPFLGGAFAGLAFFTHLNGLIFSVAGFCLLIFNRRFKNTFAFTFSAFLFSSLFFYDLWQEGAMETFLFQMRNWPDPVGASYSSLGILGWLQKAVIKLLDEQQRFFWSYKVWVVSILYILSLILFFKSLWAQNRNLLLYLFILNLTLNVLGSQIAERFLIYLLPYMAMVVGLAFRMAKEKFRKPIVWLFRGLATVQFVFCWIMVVWLIQKSGDFVGLHTRILDQIPEKEKPILVDYPLVFNGLETHRLVTFKLFEYLEVTEKMKFDLHSFTRKAHDLNIQFMVLPLKEENIENSNYSILFKDVVDYPFYEKYLESEGYLVLKHK